MQTQMQGVFRHKRGHELVNIFGYSSQGLPGIEIIGLSGLGRLIKEKLLFLSKSQGLQLPLKRYVLGVEMSDSAKDFEVESLRWLEFPILLSFWTLCDFLPISKLEDCIASGKVSVNGRVEELLVPPSIYELARDNVKVQGFSFLKVISEFTTLADGEGIVNLSSRELLKGVSCFQFEQLPQKGIRSLEAILTDGLTTTLVRKSAIS